MASPDAEGTTPELGGPRARVLPLVWRDIDSVPVVVVNQLLVQVDLAGGTPDLLLLTPGFAAAPPITGTPEEQANALEGIKEVVVRPAIRLSLTRRRLEEWVTVLTQTLEKIDEWPGGE